MVRFLVKVKFVFWIFEIKIKLECNKYMYIINEFFKKGILKEYVLVF